MNYVIFVMLFTASLLSKSAIGQDLEQANHYYESQHYDSAVAVINAIPKGNDDYKKAQKLLKKTFEKQQAIVEKKLAAKRDSLIAEHAKQQAIENHFDYQYDEFEKRKIYSSMKKYLGVPGLVYSRVVEKDDKKFIMLVLTLQTMDWLFVNNVKLLLNDDSVASFDVEPHREVIAVNNLREICHLHLDPDGLKKIAQTGVKGIRFTGGEAYEDYESTSLRYKALNDEIQILAKFVEGL